MRARFGSSYVDQAFNEEGLAQLYHLIIVVSRDRELPQPFWLFCRLLEWEGSSRSGIWQYYETIRADDFERIATALDAVGFQEISEKYRFGMREWTSDEQIAQLDSWLFENQEYIESKALSLVEPLRDTLKKVAAS